MSKDQTLTLAHPPGEQPPVEPTPAGPIPVDTYAGRIEVDWEPDAAVATLGQLPFFIGYLKPGGLFGGWVAGCPIQYTSPNAPSKRDLLGAPSCCPFCPGTGVTPTSRPYGPTRSVCRFRA